MSGAVTAAAVGGAALASGAVTAGTAAAIGLGAGSMVAQNRAAKKGLQQQQRAQAQNLANAKQAQARADQNFRAANQKQPNVRGIREAAARQGSGGQSSTMLTGPSGVASNQLSLSGNTMLGA